MILALTAANEHGIPEPSDPLTVDADTTNGTLRLQGTGAAATNIRWNAILDTVELTY